MKFEGIMNKEYLVLSKNALKIRAILRISLI